MDIDFLSIVFTYVNYHKGSSIDVQAGPRVVAVGG
jgi:hypothetical protein